MPQIKDDQLIAEAYEKRDNESSQDGVIWHGSCHSACRGAWYNLEKVNWDYIKSLFNTDSKDPEGRGSYLKFGEQDIQVYGEIPFPLRCYLPPTFEEFKQLLEKGEVIRFIDNGTDHFEIYCLNKKKCYDVTQETLNVWCDLTVTDF